MNDERPKRTIDERIEALTMNMELLETQVQETGRRVDQLANVVTTHEEEWERFRRAMQTGLRIWLNGEKQA